MRRFFRSRFIHRVKTYYKKIVLSRSLHQRNDPLSPVLSGALRTVLAAADTIACCPYGEDRPLILEETADFVAFSDAANLSERIDGFFKTLCDRRNLCYDEIDVLIPCLLFHAMERIATGCEREREAGIHLLRVASSYRGGDLILKLSPTERVLLRDKVYPRLDDSSKGLYRMKLRTLRRRSGVNERDIAVGLLHEARRDKSGTSHVGRILLDKPRKTAYFPVLALTFLLLLFIGFALLKNAVPVLIALIPLFLSAKEITDHLFSRLRRSEILPKIRITERNCPVTMVTVIAVVSDRADAERLLHKLDVLAAQNRISNVRVGLLLDLPEANAPLSDSDRDLLSYLENQIQIRNKNNNRYFCFIRKRREIVGTFRYAPYGRKQGAIMDFCDYLVRSNDRFLLSEGVVCGATYMVMLDEDTEPVPGSISSLIGFMEYPDHGPKIKIDQTGFGHVSDGYAMAAPLTRANPRNSYATPYASVLAANAGTEVYRNPHFELYQDLFGSGSFYGKGIVRIDLYDRLITRRFSNDPLLSHDLPEGEILRCATLSDTVFFDSIPHDPVSEQKRRHRWMRGDFQNLGFLRRSKNRSVLFSFKIILNLLRALRPFFLFILIVFGAFVSPIAPWFAVFLIFLPAILSLFATVLGDMSRALYPFRGFVNVFQNAALEILLLPSSAALGLDAAIRGIFRLIRGMRKLEWTTAAACSGAKSVSDHAYALRYQLIGFLLLFLPTLRIFGLIWIITPVISYRLSRPYPTDTASESELCEDARKMWGFFEANMTARHHWLAPDNEQVSPLGTVAARTSPTNIGLGLLSLLGAYRLSLICEQGFFDRCHAALETLESLPKWNGHLYNWYDTQTLKVLPERFVSSVDCGNLAACLHALSQGIDECFSEKSEPLCTKISKLLDAMDFSLLYDAKARLFPIGYHVDEGRFSDSYYDLYASESRLTSYYAIMKGQVPVSHWASLSRPSKKASGKLIVSGWSGTMFEYFMPHIFLPAFRNTLSGEMLRGILFAQKGYVSGRCAWGISESGYYEFDSVGNYAYRAFGIPSAALRRDVSFPLVISPYSTFLAYPYFPSEAKRNKTLLAQGKYGCYEAVDYRCGTENPRIVRSFMAHHVAMSFLSVVNAVSDRAVRRWFMKGEGEAFVSLLTESLPDQRAYRFCPAEREEARNLPQITVERPDPEHPTLCLMTNGRMSEIVSDCGSGVLRRQGIDLIEYPSDCRDTNGVFVFIRHKGTLYSATYAPLWREGVEYRTFFEERGATFYASFPEFETRLSVTLASGRDVSIRELTIKNNQMTEGSFEVFLYLAPTVSETAAYRAHPEYKDLFLSASYDPNEQVVTFSRTDEPGTCFSVKSSLPVSFDVRRDCFGSFDSISSAVLRGVSEFPIFPALILRAKVEVRGRGTERICFYLCAEESPQRSFEAIRACEALDVETHRARCEQFFDGACIARNMMAEDRKTALRLASFSLFPCIETASKRKLVNTLCERTLYKYGISGSRPILGVRVGIESASRISPYLKTVSLLAFSGFPVDLVLLFRESDGYLSPLRTRLEAAVAEWDESVRKHVFLQNVRDVEEYLFFRKASKYFVNLERGRRNTSAHRSFRPIRSEGVGFRTEKIVHPCGRGGYTKQGSYVVDKSEGGGYRPYSLVLANAQLGTVINERSLGYTFYCNAAEMRITPRIRAGGYATSERLYAVYKGRRYDLLRNATVEFTTRRAIYRIAIFGVKITVEVFVARHLAAKLIRVSVKGENVPRFDIVYEPKVILSSHDRGTVTRSTENGRVFYRNPFSERFAAATAVLFSVNGCVEGGTARFSSEGGGKYGYFILACAPSKRAADAICSYLSESGRAETERKRCTEETFRSLRIQTPSEDLNAFINGFLEQQVRSSRLFGRTGPSQPGGAFGFRDQLQDAISLSSFDPHVLRKQILLCCSKQFEQGDVLHWWHPRLQGESDGLRSRYSDDPFWLVYACTEYYRQTQDRVLFSKRVSYLHAPELSDGEKDRYFVPAVSEQRESVYEHAMLAFRYALRRGARGLILFGCGDWNDGMNALPEGSESVWCTMFALLCAERFVPLAESFGTQEDVSYLLRSAEELRESLQKTFHNGRYLRGIYPNGEPIEGETGIDLLPQAFSVFCGLDRAADALDLCLSRLYDRERRIVRLLDPPYRSEEGKIGSIANYPEGVRENGGQYTHAAIWLARALLTCGRADEGAELLSAIDPVSHCKTPKDSALYGAEPYVLCADVYTLGDRFGYGGWSHYTGAAGWYLRTWVDLVFGIRRAGDRVFFSPSIPSYWKECSVDLRICSDHFHVTVRRADGTGVFENGERIECALLCGKRHEIAVIV